MRHDLKTVMIIWVIILAGCSGARPIEAPTTSVKMTALTEATLSFTASPGINIELPKNDSGTYILEPNAVRSNNFITTYGGKLYFTNVEGLYSWDGNSTKVEISSDADGPLYFSISGGKLLYITQYQPCILIRDMNDLSGKEEAFGDIYMDTIEYYNIPNSKFAQYDLYHNDGFVVAEGHVYYKGKDRKLHCATVEGKNDRIISNINADRLNYAHGFIYFTDEREANGEALYRIKTDGTNQKKLQKSLEDGFFVSTQGSLYYIKYNDEISKFSIWSTDADGNEIQVISQYDWLYSLIDITDTYVFYYYCSDYGEITGLYRMPLSGGDMETILQTNSFISSYGYPPVLADEYIYFYMTDSNGTEGFYRIRKDGEGFQMIGPPHGLINCRE
jgi:hypothetical protein